MRHQLLSVMLLCFLLPLSAWARLRVSPGQEDIREMAEHAPLVFRGQVVQLDLTKNQPENKEGIAVIAVDRWYKRAGQLPNFRLVRIRFAYNNGMMGHNCMDLLLDSYWIFFAQPRGEGELEFFHDCQGALTVSSLLAPQVSGDLLSRIELDFRAGVRDSYPEARLASLQRLAGLGLQSSREVLHEVIAHGNELESKWALFAAVKTGDVSAVSLAVPMLVKLRHETPGPYDQPDFLVALAVQKIRAVEAVPDLIEILNNAADELVRSCVSDALKEIKDPRALDTLAAHLSDPSAYVRYNSLIGMEYMTHAPACTIATPDEAEKVEPVCKSWWESKR